MSEIYKNGIVILDFGSQYTQLIARRVRESNVFSEILSPDTKLNEIINRNPAAIILSGGPSSVFSNNALRIDPEILKYNKPILGICYGLQLLIHSYGGNVEEKNSGEYGLSKLNVDNSRVFSNIHNYGNTTAASVGIALSEALEQKKIKDNDIVVLAAFGSGFYWCSIVIRW